MTYENTIINLYVYRNKFKTIQTEYIQKQFERLLLQIPVTQNYKPRYWNFRTNDLFEGLDKFEHRLSCIKVCKYLQFFF